MDFELFLADKFIPEHSLLINLLNILDIIIEEGKIVDAEIASTGTDDDDCSFTEWNDKNGQKFSVSYNYHY